MLGPGTHEARTARRLHRLGTRNGTALEGTIDLATSRHRFAIVGAEPDDRLGSAIAITPGDEDGPPKLFVVASDADGLNNERVDSGEIYLVDVTQDGDE